MFFIIKGLIKIRGDQCWRDLTCMNYHYEVINFDDLPSTERVDVILKKYSSNLWQTQPVPNPMSYFMHQSPEIFHKSETLVNHFIELVVPFFIFLTRRFRIWCGILQILFQVSFLSCHPFIPLCHKMLNILGARNCSYPQGF